MKEMTPNELIEYSNNNKCILIDVRTEREWETVGKPDGDQVGLRTYFVSIKDNEGSLNGNFVNNDNFFRRKINRNNGNVQKLISKYNDLAREALSNGDKILSENYLQHSEHFSRILISQENLRNHNENTSDNNTSNQVKVETEKKEAEETTTK